MNKPRLIAAVIFALVIGALFVVNGGLDEPRSDGNEAGQPIQNPQPHNNDMPVQPGKKFNL